MRRVQLKLPQLPSAKGINIGLTLKISTIVFSVLALFYRDIEIVFVDALYSESTSYILAVPFIFAYLVYRKRKMLRAILPLENSSQPKKLGQLPVVAGIMLTITAVLLYLYGSYTFTPLEYHMFALPLFAAGLTLTIFSPQALRQLAFPIAFLFFLTPPPTEILYTVGATLSTLSSEASAGLAMLMGVPSTLTSQYGNPMITVTRPDGASLQFSVDVACSGIYSLIGFLIFAILIAYIIRGKLWKKITLVLIGIPVIYSLNIIRITTILLLGYHYGETIALQVFHLLGGWVLTFLGTLLLLLGAEKILKAGLFRAKPQECLSHNQISQSDRSFCSQCGEVTKTNGVKIRKSEVGKLAAIVFCAVLLVSIQTPVFALTRSPAVTITDSSTGQQASTEILPIILEYTLQFQYRDTHFEQLAKEDMALAYLYTPRNENSQPIWVSLEIASTRSSLHRWETCLVNYPLRQGWKPKVTQIELRDIQLSENPPIISRYFVFEYTKTNQTQAVLYWYESAMFTLNSTSQQKHVKISLIAYPDDQSKLTQIENQMLHLAESIVDYWQPIKVWSWVTILLSQNGAYLTATTSVLFAATTMVFMIESKKQRKISRNAYLKLSKPNKQLIDTIRETEKKTTPTIASIADAYQETTGQALANDQLLQKLRELEKIGTVKSCIANKHDAPIQTWKTQN